MKYSAIQAAEMEIQLHNPIMAIQQAYSKVNAVGSATAMVALKSGDR